MKRTQVTDLLANIKSSFVSFFSIFMFAALGVGIFLGITWAGPALQNAADTMFDKGSFHNFQIVYPYGVTESDVAQLAEVEGVTAVEAECQYYETMHKDNRKYTVKVQSLGQTIDTPIILEGNLPTKSDEMAFHAKSAETLGVNVGDTITFDAPDAESSEETTASSGDAETDALFESASAKEPLKRHSFKVTAIVDSAEYVAESSATYGISTSPSGTVDGVAWVTDDVFDLAAFQNGYPVVNVRCDSLAGLNSFGNDYAQAADKAVEPIQALGTVLATARYDDLHGQAQKRIEEAQAKLDKAEADIAKGEQEIAEGEIQLEQGRAELQQKRAEGQAMLDAAYEQLMDGEAQKAAGESKLEEARAKVAAGQQGVDEVFNAIAVFEGRIEGVESYKATCDKDLAAGKITQQEYNKRLDERGAQESAEIQALAREVGVDVPVITHENYEDALQTARSALSQIDELPVVIEGQTMTLGEARKLLESVKSQLADAEAEYDQKVAELNDGWSKYYDGQATLEYEVAQGEQMIADGEAQLEDAKRQVEEGKRLVAENKPKLDQAKLEFESMQKFDWTIMPRAYNAGAAEVSTFSRVTGNLSISMAALFLIVGLLVSYFAVSRIVHEQVTQIGTKKALGFRQREITVSYLWYSGIAVVAGAIVGAIVGFLLVEGIIGGVLAGMFAFGSYPAYFGWGLFLIMTVIELALVLGATYLACRSVLKEHAVELLKGEKPPTGKTRFYEKWGIWDKLPLFVQTIVNNCVNDKRRVLSTIVGVAGCTALIVTAITLNNDVMKSYDAHYTDVYGFDTIAYADYTPDNAIDNLETALQREGATTAQVSEKRLLMVQPDGKSGTMRVIVPTDEEAFAQLYHVNLTTGGTFDLSGEGAWVSQAYADHFGAKVGDNIVVDGSDGMKHEVPILGFYEFWLTYHEMVVGRDYYEKEFGSTWPNVVLTQKGDASFAEIEQAVSGVDGFDSIFDDATYQYGNFATFSSVSSAVVIIYLALATLMAIVVLLNLNVMFIEEKKRELIVLMINGFSVKDARHYISYDSIVLTALGIIVGLVLGCIMGSITVMSIEPSTGVFIKSPDFWAILIGIVGSAILAIIMSLIALRRIPKFKLTDINKF